MEDMPLEAVLKMFFQHDGSSAHFDNQITAWRIPSSWMWHRVDLMWTDVSEEHIASILRVEKSASEEPAWAGGCILSQRRYVPLRTRSTLRHIPEDNILHSHLHENLKSYRITAYLHQHYKTRWLGHSGSVPWLLKALNWKPWQGILNI
jgi:hypothetical protein